MEQEMMDSMSNMNDMTMNGMMMEWGMLNWSGIVIAAVLAFVLGYLWFGMIFGEAWAKATGINKAQAAKMPMHIPMAVEFLSGFAQAVLLALLAVGLQDEGIFACAVMLYALVGTLAIASGNLWQMKPFKLTQIVAGNFIVTVALMAVILTHVSF